MQVKIEYIALSGQETASSLLLSGETETQIKDKFLAKMNITRKEGESHVDAWGRHLHEINELEFTKPYHPAIKDAIMGDRDAHRFMFFLA